MSKFKVGAKVRRTAHPDGQGFTRSKTMFWNKREDAQAVLDVILKAFDV